VAYHGGDTEKYLGEADGISAPLLMHLAEHQSRWRRRALARACIVLSRVAPSMTTPARTLLVVVFCLSLRPPDCRIDL
jgi:hypothetical protein